jgi:hypothetical protein
MTTPAGWHPDPEGSGQLRWWDGQQWTSEVRKAWEFDVWSCARGRTSASQWSCGWTRSQERE